jgi:hypothetical protein
MASGNVLQMDQAAPQNQGFLRHQRERRENPDPDRRLGLRPRRHRPEATWPGGEPLPNSTDSQRHTFRENAYFTGLPVSRLPNEFTSRRQPVDFVRLIAGH